MSAPDLSGDLGELVKWIRMYCSADKLLREHRPDATGRCGVCRSKGCTLYAAAREAKRLGGSHHG